MTRSSRDTGATNRRGGLATITDRSSWATVRRGIAETPEILVGLWLTLLLGALAAAGRIVVPLAVQVALDDGLLSPGGAEAATTVVGTVVAIGGGALLLAGLSSSWMNRRLFRKSEAALATLRKKAFARVHRLEPGVVGAERSGSLVSRVTSDIDTISNFTQAGGVLLLVNAAQMSIATVVMASYSWLLALIVVITAFTMVIGLRGLQRLIATRYGEVRRRIGTLQSAASQSITAAAVVKANGIAPRIQAGLDAAINSSARAQIRVLFPQNLNAAFGELVSSLITVAVVVLGVLLATQDLGENWFAAVVPALSAGQVVAFLFLITFFVRPLQFSVQILGEAQNAVAGWRRVLEILATPDTSVHRRPGSPVLEPGALTVEANGVSARYGEGHTVLDAISVTIPAGSHVAVVGETGSGKSTFAKILTRQLPISGGSLRINGVPLDELTDDTLVRRVAIVPQDAFLFDGTVAENIAITRQVDTPDRVNAVLEALGLTEWVAALPDGAETRVGQRGEQLSAGERQLVALARTAYVDPDLLVLDEATSGVDPAMDVRVQRALAGLTRGRTTVTIAHRMVTAEGADSVLVFDQGTIVEHGTHDQLVSAGGRYAELYHAWAAQREL